MRGLGGVSRGHTGFFEGPFQGAVTVPGLGLPTALTTERARVFRVTVPSDPEEEETKTIEEEVDLEGIVGTFEKEKLKVAILKGNSESYKGSLFS